MSNQPNPKSKNTRVVFWIAGSLLVLAAVYFVVMNEMMSRMSSDVPADLDSTTTRASEMDLFRVSYPSSEDGVTVNQMHQWTLHVETADGHPFDDAIITVDNDILQHGHGLPTRPQVTQNLGNGDYLVEGMQFEMDGWWVMRSVRQASGALNELAKLMPDTAELIHHGDMTEAVAVSALRHGDLILVRPGASVPANGEVVAGHSNVNEAMITVESQPVHKTNGMKVIAGTINGDGSLRVRVTATGNETALAGIMRRVEQAQQSKSRTQVLADKAAGWLFYIALASALITGIAWTIAESFNIDVLNRVVTVLVIACPHALGLAIPLVVAITTAMGAKKGILIRSRLALEAAREIDIVIFDKTGTLTQGQFGVGEMVTAPGWGADRALALAAALGSDSEHLIAQAIRRFVPDRKLTLPSIGDFSALEAPGVQATFKDETYYIGGPRLLEMLGFAPETNIKDFTDSANNKSQSVVYLTTKEKIIAAISIADVIRPESRQAVQELHNGN